MTRHKVTTAFKALALGGLSLMLVACSTSEQEKTEAIATALRDRDATKDLIVAYANYDHFNGRFMQEQRHVTMTKDVEGCQLHGEYHALRADMFIGEPSVKLNCLDTQGSIVAQFMCKAGRGAPHCDAVDGHAPAAEQQPLIPPPVKYPSLD